jgi:hypothetical protein
MRKDASALHVGKDSVGAASLGVVRCEMTFEWNWRRVDRRLFVRRCAFAQESKPAAFPAVLQRPSPGKPLVIVVVRQLVAAVGDSEPAAFTIPRCGINNDF